MTCLRLSEYDLVADLTCGMGNFSTTRRWKPMCTDANWI